MVPFVQAKSFIDSNIRLNINERKLSWGEIIEQEQNAFNDKMEKNEKMMATLQNLIKQMLRCYQKESTNYMISKRLHSNIYLI